MRDYQKLMSVVLSLAVIIMIFADSGARADMLVGTEGPPGNGAVRHYDNNGNYISDFTSGGPALEEPQAVKFGPDGNLYVLTNTDTVLRYNGTTGVFIDAFIPSGSNGLHDAFDMAFGPDGSLYISNNGNPANSIGEGGEVLRFNGKTGAFTGTFIKNGAGSGGVNTLSEAMAIAFGPDGNLYVGNDARDVAAEGVAVDSVMRFDGKTGAYIDTPVSAGFDGLYDPNGLTIGPDCNLYISSEGLLFTSGGVGSTDNPNVIYQLNIGNGNVSEFVHSNGLLNANGPFPAGTGLIEPEKIVFGPDGNLYVTSGDTAEIYRYNGTTGALIGVFVTQGLGASSTDPKGITFFPGETPDCKVQTSNPIPTLNEWGLIAMTGILGIIALLAIYRRKATA